MGKVVGAITKKSPDTAAIQDKLAAVKAENEASALSAGGVADRSMAEQLAGKKNARTRGGSRMLLSDARVNAQEGLSATSTLG